jgi:hypothetical protein
MPNFGNVGRELALEINEEPEETEEESEPLSLPIVLLSPFSSS